MRKSLRFFSVLTTVCVILCAVCALYVHYITPDCLRVCGTMIKPDTHGVPIVLNINKNTVSADTSQRKYTAEIKLFGFIPVKTVCVERVDERSVVLSGKPFGIKLHTDGVVIVGMEKISTGSGEYCPCMTAGMREGDTITAVNGVPVNDCSALCTCINQSAGREMTVLCRREDGSEIERKLTAVYCEKDKCYKAGAWVRDSAAGIGTMTYTEASTFAGLGHGICDMDTGRLMPLGSGEAVEVTVTGVTKGVDGLPGEIHGYFDTESIGPLSGNSECGVYGNLCDTYTASGKEYTVAMKQDVTEGKAYILTTIPGDSSPKLYDAVIERINYDESGPTKNMVIRVTDKRLLNATGGIVQGMSGSPVIQNGKFAAAVTHVFVNDASKGYAIFAENMVYHDEHQKSTEADE